MFDIRHLNLGRTTASISHLFRTTRVILRYVGPNEPSGTVYPSRVHQQMGSTGAEQAVIEINSTLSPTK